MVRSVAGAEHPLIAAHGPNALAHLIGQRLERQSVIRGRERAGNGIVGPFFALGFQENRNRLWKTTLQKILVSREGGRSFQFHAGTSRQMEAVDRIEEEKCTNPFIQILALSS